MVITLDGLLIITKQMHASFALGSRKKLYVFLQFICQHRRKLHTNPMEYLEQ